MCNVTGRISKEWLQHIPYLLIEMANMESTNNLQSMQKALAMSFELSHFLNVSMTFFNLFAPTPAQIQSYIPMIKKGQLLYQLMKRYCSTLMADKFYIHLTLNTFPLWSIDIAQNNKYGMQMVSNQGIERANKKWTPLMPRVQIRKVTHNNVSTSYMAQMAQKMDALEIAKQSAGMERFHDGVSKQKQFNEEELDIYAASNWMYDLNRDPNEFGNEINPYFKTLCKTLRKCIDLNMEKMGNSTSTKWTKLEYPNEWEHCDLARCGGKQMEVGKRRLNPNVQVPILKKRKLNDGRDRKRGRGRSRRGGSWGV